MCVCVHPRAVLSSHGYRHVFCFIVLSSFLRGERTVKPITIKDSSTKLSSSKWRGKGQTGSLPGVYNHGLVFILQIKRTHCTMAFISTNAAYIQAKKLGYKIRFYPIILTWFYFYGRLEPRTRRRRLVTCSAS